MADTKIDGLPALAGVDIATGDLLPIVDVSANVTKKVTMGDLDTRFGTTGITSLTADVTASGNGAVAATVAAVGGKTASAVATSVNATLAATDANTASAIVKRDGSGNFAAGTITAALAGHASLDLLLTGGTMTGPLVLAADASSALNPVTKQQFDAAVFGLDAKNSVAVVAASNLTLSGEQTIDGVLTSVSRILVKGQSTGSQNGIYVTGPSTWARAVDFDSWAETPGAIIPVESGGTVYGGTVFLCTAPASGTLGTTPIPFTQIAGAGSYTTDGQGLAIAGTQLSLALDGTSLAKSVSGLKVNITGAPVGTTDTQTLTNKTLTTPTINAPVLGTYEDYTDQGSDPAAPGAGITRLYSKAGVQWKRTATLPPTPVGSGGSSGKNYFGLGASTAVGWTKTGTMLVATDTTTADLAEPSIGTGILFTLGAIGDYAEFRFTIDPADYTAGRIPLTAAIKTLTGYVGGNAKIEVYSNTASNYGGTSTRLALNTDVSGVSGLTTATRYNGFYDSPGSNAPYIAVRIVTVVAAGSLVASSMNTAPGQSFQANIGNGPVVPFTPVIAGGATYSVNGASYVRMGQYAFVQFEVDFTSAASTSVTFDATSLFSGATIDYSVLAGSARPNLGSAHYLSTNSYTLAPTTGGPSNNVTFRLSGTNQILDNANPTTEAGVKSPGRLSVSLFIPITQWAGSVINQAASDNQFVSNFDLSNASDGSSFAYGANGSPFPNVSTTTKYKLVNFLTPFQTGEKPVIEVTADGGASWWNIEQTVLVGAVLADISSNNATQCKVYFAPGGSAATFIASSNAWSYYNGLPTLWRWRVRKSVGATTMGFDTYKAPSAAFPAGASGLVPPTGLLGRTDGNLAPQYNVGESVENSASTAGVTTAADVVSITLTAGLWLCGTSVNGNAGSGSNVMTASWKIKGTIGSTQGKDYVLNAQVVNDRGVVTLTNRVVTIAPADADKTVKLNVANTVSQNVASYIWAVRIG